MADILQNDIDAEMVPCAWWDPSLEPFLAVSGRSFLIEPKVPPYSTIAEVATSLGGLKENVSSKSKQRSVSSPK